MGMFDFNANDPTSYGAMELRRKIALQMMSQRKGFPKTLGEGLTTVGDAFGDIGIMRSLERQQAALEAGRNRVMAVPPPDAPAVSPTRSVGPQSETETANPPVTTASAPLATDVRDQGDYNEIDASANFKRPTSGYMQDAIAANEPDPDMRAYYGSLSAGEAKNAQDVSKTGAAGPFQFTRGTGKQYGLNGPGFDNRGDLDASTKAAQALTQANIAAFRKVNGRAPTFQDLALMHQQGGVTGAKMVAGTGNAPAGNLAVNNVAPGSSPQQAVAAINKYYGMPNTPIPGSRDAIAATLAGGPPDAQDARLAEVTGMSRGPTGAYSYAPTASRSGDVQSDAPNITGISPAVGAAAADTIQQQARPPAPVVPQAPAGSPPEAAGNRPIVSDIAPMPAAGTQTAQYQPPPIAPRRPTDAPVVMPPQQTAAPLPPQATGMYERPTPPKMPDPTARSPVEADFEQKSLREQDPVLQRWYAGQAAIRAEARTKRDALNTKEYESERALYDQKYRAWEDAQRKLPETAEDLKKKRYEVQQQAEQDAQRAQFGNLPQHVHAYLDEGKKNAISAVGSLEGIRNAKEVVDAGTLFGVAAPAKLLYYQGLAEAGDKNAARIVAATQTYKTALGPVAAQAIKSYGGTQISNEDRRQGMAMAGADVSLDEKTARRMLDIAERSAIAKINEHRGDLDTMLQKQPPLLRRMYDVPDPMAAIPAEKSAAAPRVFNSMEEAEAAKLDRGTRIIINGKKFKVQ